MAAINSYDNKPRRLRPYSDSSCVSDMYIFSLGFCRKFHEQFERNKSFNNGARNIRLTLALQPCAYVTCFLLDLPITQTLYIRERWCTEDVEIKVPFS